MGGWHDIFFLKTVLFEVCSKILTSNFFSSLHYTLPSADNSTFRSENEISNFSGVLKKRIVQIGQQMTILLKIQKKNRQALVFSKKSDQTSNSESPKFTFPSSFPGKEYYFQF